MSDLNGAMTIQVRTVFVKTPPRPVNVPADATWPPAAGQLLIFSFVNRHGGLDGAAMCSDCITDDARVEAYRAKLVRQGERTYLADGMPLRQVPRHENTEWGCTSSSDGYKYCGKRGTALT